MNEERLARARAVLTRMLETDFPEAEVYRSQLEVASLHLHSTGCRIEIDRQQAAPGTFDPARPSARLGVDAFGHGKAWMMLHVHEGYLDDLELLDAVDFPSPEQLKIRTD